MFTEERSFLPEREAEKGQEEAELLQQKGLPGPHRDPFPGLWRPVQPRAQKYCDNLVQRGERPPAAQLRLGV